MTTMLLNAGEEEEEEEEYGGQIRMHGSSTMPVLPPMPPNRAVSADNTNASAADARPKRHTAAKAEGYAIVTSVTIANTAAAVAAVITATIPAINGIDQMGPLLVESHHLA